MRSNIINLSEEDQQAVSAALFNSMADTFSLYFKTHSYHWNVTGSNFFSLHTLFEEQYTNMWEALDELAERMRTLGNAAPVSSTTLVKHSGIAEAKEGKISSTDMVKDLAEGHKHLVATLNAAFKVAQENGDEVTVGMLTERLDFHEKAYWMLRSSVE